MTRMPAPGSGFAPTGRLHLGVSLPGPAAHTSFEQLRTAAQTAERGHFSLLTLDERYWLAGDPGADIAADPAGSNDVGTLLAGLAAVTTGIGLAAAVAPDHDDPADQAARIATLDQLSGGRAAWQLLPDGEDPADFLPAAERLWDAWSAAANARNTRPGPVKPLGSFEHGGHQFSVGLGTGNRPAAPYRPVVVLPGHTEAERLFAARHADVVETGPAGLGDALALRRELAADCRDAGRDAGNVLILQAATFVLAETDGEAVEKAEWIREQLPESAWDQVAFVGSYQGVADELLDFARTGAVDGFTVMPWMFPHELEDIVNHLVPQLQLRGIYPADHPDPAGTSLRARLGLPDTPHPAGNRSTQAVPVMQVEDLEDIHLDIRMELVVAKVP
ncbi:hypothetical protein AL755_14710 [Arthrobacter sp. ERGS1:01]|uniref:LLM class flavin-dependent oxidoreductase n=1 Tax=Arthrobacter sp. ERGS1:01 TaxID=1704044 RepID=UPI0006B62A17|nr:LLM class flavin-dependent oxidoreductase [Arthrobacter sp. ERGS1:01]ALE06422.1 hypothetical protein AL755_14710 [Arthrobacter sp. ERGS1:01]